jgi:Na+/H+ antiporter NhaA
VATVVRREPDRTRARRRALPQQLAQPLRDFLSTEAGSAGLLLAATATALVWANSPVSDGYESLWSTEMSVRTGEAALSMDLRHWVNDGLMVFFFLVVGLEARRELTMGELTDRATRSVPFIAALAGMVVPAAVYLAINPTGEAARGWGVVIATDTAFMLGALAIVGPQSTPLRVFLLTLTIFDDIGAVAVIAVVYSDAIDWVALMVGAACLLALAALSRLEVRSGLVYAAIGLALWVAAVESGLHPTIAGMSMGLLISAYPPRREEVERAAARARAFRQSPMPALARAARLSMERAVSPNERIQTRLHPWTSYAIVPIFALANAGVDIRGGILEEAFSSPVTWGVIAGLVGGKPIGIGAASLLAVRLGVGRLPRGVGPVQVLGGAALSGIGFTVSLLFIELALDPAALREQAKVGVLTAAIAAPLVAAGVFRLFALLLGEPAEVPARLDPPVGPSRDHIRGPVEAPLTLLEFGDFECPFCGSATDTVDELRHRFGGDLRYVFRHLPLSEVHPHAELAAEAAEAASAQGRFWEYHDILFSNQDQLEWEDLLGYASELDLDVERFARELEEGVHSARVREDVASAEASGARGTPTFFVGDRLHDGPYDAETLGRELERARGERGSAGPGVPGAAPA